MNYRTFIISAPIFWGYKCKIDLDKVESNEQICNLVVNNLKNDLKEKNLIVLLEILEGKNNDIFKEEINFNFHIHNNNFGDILLSSPNDELYVCSH